MGKVTFGKAVSANAYKDNGATVVWGGTADGTTVTNVPDTAITTKPGYANGNRIQNPETDATIAADTDTAPTYKPLSAGNFAQMVAGSYVIRLAGNAIAGTTVSALAKTGNWGATHRKASVRARYAVRTIKISSWNYATGAATITSDGSTADTVEAADGTTPGSYRLADDAANRTLAVPGEFAYALGDGPTTDEYDARTHS